MKSFIVAKRLIKQLIGDKRTIVMMLVAPIFVIYLLSIILNSSPSKANIDLISAPDGFIEQLQKNANITIIDDIDEGNSNLKNKTSDGYVDFSGDTPEINVDGSDPTSSKLVINTVSKALSSYYGEKTYAIIKQLSTASNTKISTDNLQTKPEVKYYYGSDSMTTFDSLSPLFMGFFIFFFVFLIAGVSFLRERISGTLDRILATTLKRSEIVLGYFLGFGCFVSIQTLLIQVFMFYYLKIEIKGSFLTVLLINIILAAGSLSLGTFLSTFARNELQLFQFIPVIIVPQILFCGIFNLREAPVWVNLLSKIFPLTYGAEALKNVVIKGFSLSEVIVDVIILTGFAVLFIILNILALKKYRRI